MFLLTYTFNNKQSNDYVYKLANVLHNKCKSYVKWQVFISFTVSFVTKAFNLIFSSRSMSTASTAKYNWILITSIVQTLAKMRSKPWGAIERLSRRIQEIMMEKRAILLTEPSRINCQEDLKTHHLFKTAVRKSTFVAARIELSKTQKTWLVTSANCTMVFLLKVPYTEFAAIWCLNNFRRANNDSQQFAFSFKKADSFVAAGLATLVSLPLSIISFKSTTELLRLAQ